MNVLFILSDEHTRDILGAEGNKLVETPNLDRLAGSGTRFAAAYTPCPICIPARASIATGRHVHEIGFWDNGIPYDGSIPSWHHELRDQGLTIDSIGKLHFKGHGSDHGFSHEIEPLHVVDGVGDVLGCIRDDAPQRHKRAGILEAGPGDSTYITYDAQNAERACRWLDQHVHDEQPWVLQLGFVLPHPPYIAPPEYYHRYAERQLPMPPQWDADHWPDHPVIARLRRFFDFDTPFAEEEVRNLVTAYYGAVSYLDSLIGTVLDHLEHLGLSDDTLVIYTSDHGECMGARGLFGKFTMYEESAAVPLILSGPDVPRGAVCESPVSLIDIHPTILAATGAAVGADLPSAAGPTPAGGHPPSVFPQGAASPAAITSGVSLLDATVGCDPGRVVLSQYHAVGSRHGYCMIRQGSRKYVHYVDAPPELFDLATDPLEETNLAPTAAPGELESLEAALRTFLDPEIVDARARRDQAAMVERRGGRKAVLQRGAFDNSPVPGEAPKFHI